MILFDEIDQLGPMPIVERALKQLAGHGARVSIITQSIPGLDNIYGENVRMSLESAAGMKLYLAANDKKTVGEICDALGKTARLAVSDSLSRDRDFLQRRSVSRRMEERPLLSPDKVRRLGADKAILIPEQQNPLIVQRIVYFQDPTFLEILEAQNGPMPYPSTETAKVHGLVARMDAIVRKITQLGQIEYIRKSAKPAVPKEPGLAMAAVEAGDWGSDKVELTTDFAEMTSSQDMAVARMGRFTAKLADLEG